LALNCEVKRVSERLCLWYSKANTKCQTL